MRRTAIAFAAISALFILWEGEDNLVLGRDLLFHSMQWRNEEITWQQTLDRKSPKVGDEAQDFELQDPEGNVRVRLSDFRGKRPVALVFGSYT
jgi:peroxiredoxin